MLTATLRKSLMSVAMAGAMAVAGTSATAAELRGWNIHVEDYPVSIAMESFMVEVAEKTGGEITGKIYRNGVLGSQPDAIAQIRPGIIDFGVFSPGPMGQSIPETNVVSRSFIFLSIPKMYELWTANWARRLAQV